MVKKKIRINEKYYEYISNEDYNEIDELRDVIASYKPSESETKHFTLLN